jgi:MGT family glycosyltransferase
MNNPIDGRRGRRSSRGRRGSRGRHALVFNIPAHGHVNPTLPVIQELIRRGHRVTYYAMTPFREQITAAGGDFQAYESLVDDLDAFFDPEMLHAPSMGTLVSGLMEACEVLLPRLLARVRQDPPDYIVHDFMCLWGRYLAARLGIPAVMTIPIYPVAPQGRPPLNWPLLRESLKILADLPALIRFWRAAGRVSRTYDVERPGPFDVFTHAGDLNIVFTSRYFHAQGDAFDARFVFVGPSIAPRDEVLDFSLDFAPGPLVYVSLGTVFGDKPAFFRTCFAAFGGTDTRVVLSVGQHTDIARLAPIPENIVVRRYVPQLEILKQADVFITHGGMNSVSEGLSYGVPLVVIPQAVDQFLIAQRVAALDAGYVLRAGSVTPAMLRDRVAQVPTDPRVCVGSAAVAASFHEAGGSVRAADAIQSYVHP